MVNTRFLRNTLKLRTTFKTYKHIGRTLGNHSEFGLKGSAVDHRMRIPRLPETSLPRVYVFETLLFSLYFAPFPTQTI